MDTVLHAAATSKETMLLFKYTSTLSKPDLCDDNLLQFSSIRTMIAY